VPPPGKRGRISNRVGAAPYRSRPAGMSDRRIDRVLDRLEKLGGGADSRWPEQVAAHLSLDPMLTDETLANRFNVSAASVAQVRGNIAAGRPPGRRIPHARIPAVEPPGPASDPPARPAPSAPASGAHGRCGATLAHLPTFAVVTATGETVASGLQYRPAMVARLHAGEGAHLAVEEP
jgi:hypothetical protein